MLSPDVMAKLLPKTCPLLTNDDFLPTLRPTPGCGYVAADNLIINHHRLACIEARQVDGKDHYGTQAQLPV